MKKDVAIACYIDNDEGIQRDFQWLLKSWRYSGSWLVSDILAFYHPDVPAWMLPEEQGVSYIPVTAHADKYKDWTQYRFINSIGYMGEPEAGILATYRYILRTDCDCFLTPFFKDLRPRLTTFGAGQFADDPAAASRLVDVAKRWGIFPVFNNIGSTVMGLSGPVMTYSLIQLEYCKRLRDEEFQEGPGQWPGWYIGVMSMYAGQLAAQAYFGQSMTIGGLDCHCLSHDKIGPQDYHIHAWHTFEHFSKFNWRAGKYMTHDMASLDVTKVADYCLWIAGPGPETQP